MQLLERCGLILACSGIIFLTASPVWAQDDTLELDQVKKQLQQIYVEGLRDAGYVPSVDEDGDVQFEREELAYFISVHPDDPQFFGLMLPYIWEIESDQERLYALFACNVANASTKVAKVQVVGDNVWVSAELFVPKPTEFRSVLSRLFSAMDSAMMKFVDTMAELEDEN